MSLLLAIAGWTLFTLAIVAGLLLDLVGLFGNWIILAAVAVAGLLTGFAYFGGWTIPVLFGLAVLGEVFEAVASGFGAAHFGGGKGTIAAAVVGCLLGAVAGTPVLPIVGTVIGACVGAFMAAALYEYLMLERHAHDAMYIGFGAALGKIGGILLKAFVGVVMVVTAFAMS